MEKIIEITKSIFEPALVVVILLVLLRINSWLFNRGKSYESNGRIIKNSISFLLILSGTLIFILSLPIESSLKGQILTFLGIIISAGIALSSTTLLGNLIAGIMNNSMRRFRNGDLIRIGEMQGRVTHVSIFHTEIQMEDSNFITIPNLYIANHPVKLTRKSNTVISASVSLGYDITRTLIVETLKEAAADTGLKDPYVYITSLGDYSVAYRIHGFLDDSSNFFSVQSLLNSNVMDKLHEKNIEIVSPTFMNQRRVDEHQFIPQQVIEPVKIMKESSPENQVFDEAIKSEKIEEKKDFIKKIDEELDLLKKKMKEARDENEAEKIKSQIVIKEGTREKMEQSIKEQTDMNDEFGEK